MSNIRDRATQKQISLANVIVNGNPEYNALYNTVLELIVERDEYALLLFQPIGVSHHDATKCPYCKENINGKA